MFLDKLSILVAIGNTVKSSPGLEQHWMRLSDRASQAKQKNFAHTKKRLTKSRFERGKDGGDVSGKAMQSDEGQARASLVREMVKNLEEG